MITVRRTFKTIQITNELVLIPNYNFSKVAKHKLISSIYLVIDSSNINNLLRSDKMRIFVHLEYFLDTSYETYMINLMLITKEDFFYIFIYYEGFVKLF